MNVGRDLFSPSAAPYQRHSETSKESALNAEPKAGTKRFLLLEFLRARGAVGATDEEMQDALHINPNTQRPRRGELVERKFVVESDITRTTTSGGKATVWIAAEFAEA